MYCIYISLIIYINTIYKLCLILNDLLYKITFSFMELISSITLSNLFIQVLKEIFFINHKKKVTSILINHS